MRTRTIDSWLQVGERVAQARRAAGLTQEQLAGAVKLDRTALSKVESGQRGLDALELGRFARELKRTVSWFLTRPTHSLSSRRSSIAHREPHPVDDTLEEAVQNVELLQELGVLKTRAMRIERGLETFEDAETAAAETRRRLGRPKEALWDLARITEECGLIAFSIDLASDQVDGVYAALDEAGVAIVNGHFDSGRRRFTLAHELAHHILQDEFSSDWDILAGADTRERLMNAFAVHFLLPRRAAEADWRTHAGASKPWEAALALGARFGLSWSALILHLKNLGLIDQRVHEELRANPPRSAHYIEREMSIPDDLRPPSVPPRYAAAAVKAFRSQKISEERAVELLFGTLRREDLPTLDAIPLDALRSELKRVR
jgi:Zn-dependent peptidase ImmA (M78 family)/transcriptional regulator with XRE-family HTH domain